MSSDLPIRPPCVVVLGHVNHGKTTLLDYIRKTELANKEEGGITQSIGGYEIKTGITGYPTDKITFIDTPGHEAFNKLRERGTKLADIAILVVDATESVKPQTIESIEYIKNAEIPYIAAINKIDLPHANVEKVTKDLIKYGVVVESRKGNIISIPISAKKGTGVKDLLEAILLLATEKRLTYNPKAPLTSYILETKKDRRGIVASIIIKNGVLRKGQTLFLENNPVKVRSIINWKGKVLNEAIPTQPVEILGFDKLPPVGFLLSSKPYSLKSELSKNIPQKKKISLEEILNTGNIKKTLKIILKADSIGSLEAISNKLGKKTSLQIINKDIGNIQKSDIFLAKTTQSIIIGFSVKIDQEAKILAKQEKILIKNYTLIYKLLEEVEEVANILKEKEREKKIIKGEAKILETFIIEGERIFGAKVKKGKVGIGDRVEIYRNENIIGKTKIISLRHRAKIIKEAKKDEECGIIFSPSLDIKKGDVVKSIL